MNKRGYYLLSLVLFIIAAGFVVVKYKRDKRSGALMVYVLKERQGGAAQLPEWKQVRDQYAGLMKIIGTNPEDLKSRLSLAALYIQEARVTGNYSYYDMAAMKYVNEVLEQDPQHFEALIYKSLLFLSQHHFAEGLAVADEARKLNPDNAFVYGVLIDGNVEMGNYKAAVDHAEKMVSIRPDMRSYSRISYLREIHGDYPGAIEAMKLAIDAAPPGEEATEWARIQLGHLFENTGELEQAELCYQQALQYRPNYGPALAGLARMAVAKGDFASANELYLQAGNNLHDYTFREELVEMYRWMGNNEKADSVAQMLIKEMTKEAQSGNTDEQMGHYADRELANIYLQTGDVDKALEHALLEYNRRPGNIDINETVAWIYFKRGEGKRGLPYAEAALKTQSSNPTLLCHIGLLYAATGKIDEGKSLLQAALKNNPNLSPSLRKESEEKLRSL